MDVNNEKKAIIELQGICKSFSVGKRTAKVLKGIDLSINNGEMTAIMGASGCGKSTLLNIIGCLDVAESGEYWLKGKKVTGKSQKEMAKIRNEIFGYVIQDFALIRDDTVLENIRIPLDYSKKKIDKLRIDQLLKSLGLKKLQKMRVSLLSGGEQQRTAIARALVNDPEILLADEPTGNLDPQNSWDIMALLEDMNRLGTTVMVVTHNNEIVNQMQKRVVTLHEGVIISDQIQGGYVQ